MKIVSYHVIFCATFPTLKLNLFEKTARISDCLEDLPVQLALSFIYGYKPRIEKNNVHDIMVVVVDVVVSFFSVQPVRKIFIR